MPTQYKWLPSEPTKEMTMAWCANCHAWDLDAYKAMWQAAPVVEQEPVAYIAVRDFGIDITHIETIAIMWGVPYKPLYTHQQPKREPLSEYRIWELWDSREVNINVINLARAIEKAHGIGGSE